MAGGAATIPLKDGKTAVDYLSDGIYAISQIGKPKVSDFVDTYKENTVELNLVIYSGEYSYSIPQLSFDGPDVDDINQEILDTMLPMAEYIDESAENHIPPIVDELDYGGWVNGDILTLELRTSWTMVSEDWDTYQYYCIDTSTGKMVTNQQILADMGMTEAEFLSLAQEKISADLRKLLKESAKAINGALEILGIDPIFTEENLQELTKWSIPTENLENIRLYYGKGGAVMMQYQIRYADGITGLTHSVKIK